MVKYMQEWKRKHSLTNNWHSAKVWLSFKQLLVQTAYWGEGNWDGFIRYFLFKYIFFLFHVDWCFVCICLCVGVRSPGTRVVSCHVVLGIEPRCSRRASSPALLRNSAPFERPDKDLRPAPSTLSLSPPSSRRQDHKLKTEAEPSHPLTPDKEVWKKNK